MKGVAQTERNNRIIKLHNDGLSHGQVIRKLSGHYPDLTRGAVGGVIHRNPGKIIPNKDREARRSGNNRNLPVKDPQPFILPSSKCQWIDGMPSADDRCKCGKDTVPHRRYCDEHNKRSIKPLPARKDLKSDHFNQSKKANF